MRNNLKLFGLLLFFLLLASAPLLAQETEEAQGTPLTYSRAKLFMVSLIVGGAVITLCVAAGTFCQAKAISKFISGRRIRNCRCMIALCTTVRALLLLLKESMIQNLYRNRRRSFMNPTS